MSGKSKGFTRWGIILGVAAGFVVWAYDYDFFLNAGGPETPISNAIRVFTIDGWLFFVFWPLLVLMTVGAALGLTLSWLFAGQHRT